MNKTEAIKFLNNYLDSQEVQYMTTVFEKRSIRRGVTRSNAMLRTITDGEIIIEYDMPMVMRRWWLTKQATNRLKNNGYNFLIWKAQNQKSAHIHIYDIKGLDKLDKEINREYKKLFLNKYGTKECDVHINTKSYQPIAMENKPHFKYNTVKEIVYNHNNGSLSNKIELDLLEKATDNVNARKYYQQDEARASNDYDNTWFIKWITTETLPRGQRDTVILKNLSIMMEQKLVNNEEEVVKKLSEIYNHKVYSLVYQWRKWAKNKHFSIGEIINYCDNHDLEFGKIRKKYMEETKEDNIEIKSKNHVARKSY